MADKDTLLLDKIKEEKEFLKTGTETLEKAANISDQDKEYFKNQKKVSRAASTYADTIEMRALLLLQLVQERNKLVFLLFRKGLLTETLEKRFRKATPIEDAIKWYNEEKAKTDAVLEERNKQFAEFKKTQDKMEIFKAVLNGMSVEDAEARLKEYDEQMKQAIQGQQGK